MQLVITAEESGKLDAGSPVPVETLMERAGLAVALAAVRLGAGYGKRVAVLAGTGSNGGDGWVAARYLADRGCQVTVHFLGFPKGEHSAARKAAVRATGAGVAVRKLGEPAPCDVLIDALFGVGFRGRLPEAVVPWTATTAPVLAVDVPSGLLADTGEVEGTSFVANRTVTFHALKPGHLLGQGPERCGRIEVIDIGLIGGEPELLVAEDTDAPRPTRPRTAHKWSAGSVAVVGGSPGLSGAALLAADAALNAGAGAVMLAVPHGLEPAYEASAPGLLTRAIGSDSRFYASDATAVLEAADRFDVMVLGPGLGRDQGPFVKAILDGWHKGIVIDADALNALDDPGPLEARTSPTVITPHAGEYRRLFGAQPDYRSASELPDRLGVIVLLKGNPTFVLGAERWLVKSGGAELASIGTGDVLAGFIAALWARGLDPERACRSAAHWHGRAGVDLARSTTVTAAALASHIGRFAW